MLTVIHAAQHLEFFYLVNYYFKYLELLDTVFLALKKKPLGALDGMRTESRN